jgi:hypothetical protein
MLVETDEHEKKIASLPVTAGIITGLCTEIEVAAVTTTQETEQSLANRGFANSTFQVFAVYHLYPGLHRKKGGISCYASVFVICVNIDRVSQLMRQDWHTFACTGHGAVITYETPFLSSTYA